MNREEIRSRFKPGDRIRYGVVWLTNDVPRQRIELKGFFHSWDDSYRASPHAAFVSLDRADPVSGTTFLNVDARTLTLITALVQLAEIE